MPPGQASPAPSPATPILPLRSGGSAPIPRIMSRAVHHRAIATLCPGVNAVGGTGQCTELSHNRNCRCGGRTSRDLFGCAVVPTPTIRPRRSVNSRSNRRKSDSARTFKKYSRLESQFPGTPPTPTHSSETTPKRMQCPPPPSGGRRNRPPPPPSRAPSLCPATVPLTASAGFNATCNRQ